MEQTPKRPFDEYLVLLSQAGSADAWEGLVRRWTPRLMRYSARVLGGSAESYETAKDIVQETWVGAVRGLRGLRDPEQFPAWIYGIATRKCADAIRTNIRRRKLDANSAADEASREETSVSIEHQIDMATAIRQLPPKLRAAVHLFYVEDLTVQEIALALSIPVGTVKSRLHHAREALKHHFDAGVGDAAAFEEHASQKRGTS